MLSDKFFQFFSYFFVYYKDLPENFPRLDMYGIAHISFLILTLIIGIIACRWYKKLSERKQIQVGHIIGISMVCMDIYKDIVLFSLGYMSVQYLPLHLCGLSIYVELLYSYYPRPFIGNFIFCLSAPGALSAILFPDWTSYNVWNFMNIHGFALHGLLVIYACMLIYSGRIKPDIKYVKKVFLSLIPLSLVIHIINVKNGSNFLFIERASPGSPLVAISNITGPKFYIIGYAAFVAALVFIFYSIAIIYGLIKKRK